MSIELIPTKPIDSLAFAEHAASGIVDTHTTEEVPTYLGIPISQAIINQLKMITGLPMSRISADDIGEAVRGFEGDTEIVEDHMGMHLADKMRLDLDEIPTEQFGTYAHNFDITPAIEAAQDLAESIISEAPSYLAKFSFVERYLAESTSNMLSLC